MWESVLVFRGWKGKIIVKNQSKGGNPRLGCCIWQYTHKYKARAPPTILFPNSPYTALFLFCNFILSQCFCFHKKTVTNKQCLRASVLDLMPIIIKLEKRPSLNNRYVLICTLKMLGGLNAASLQISTHFPFDQAIPLTYTWVQYPIFKMIKKKGWFTSPLLDHMSKLCFWGTELTVIIT